MVGGIIKDFFVKEAGKEKSVVKFLVEDTPYSTPEYCTVKAEVPNDAIKFDMIKVGKPIWWHNPYVLIKIEESEDMKFKKVGFSSGNYETFYEDKNKLASV